MRENVLVLGDIVEDTDMVDHSQHENILAVGFLNDMDKNGHLLEQYMEAFDMVITGDGPLTPVNVILDKMADEVI